MEDLSQVETEPHTLCKDSVDGRQGNGIPLQHGGAPGVNVRYNLI